jgi:DNA-binding CsgD family transcriptional regulator
MDDAEAIAREVTAREAAQRTQERVRAAGGTRARSVNEAAAPGRGDRDAGTAAAASRVPRAPRLTLVSPDAPGDARGSEGSVPGLPGERVLQVRFKLTRTQARVALELAAGRKNREIAARWARSEHTIKRHVEQVLMKLRVPGRSWVLPTLLGRGTRGVLGR